MLRLSLPENTKFCKNYRQLQVIAVEAKTIFGYYQDLAQVGGYYLPDSDNRL